MKIVKFLLRFLLYILTLFFVIAGMILLFLYFSDINKYKDFFVYKFKEETNQELVLDGPIELKIIPLPRINLNNAKFIFKPKDHVVEISAKTFEFGIDFLRLFSDSKSFNPIRAKNVAINVYHKNTIIQNFNLNQLSGRLIAKSCLIIIPNFKLETNNNEMSGSLEISYLEQIPLITGTIKTNTLEVKSENSALSAFDFEWLDSFKADINLKAERLNLDQISFNKVNMDIKTKEKKILAKVSAGGEIGQIKGDLVLHKNAKKEALEADTHLEIKQMEEQVWKADLNIIFLEKPKINGTVQTSQYTFTSNSTRLFSIEPFFVKWPNLVSQIDLNIDSLKIKEAHFNNAKIHLNVKDAEIAIKSTAVLNQGNFTSDILIQKRENLNNDIQMQIGLTNALASGFLKIFSKEASLNDGILNFNFQGTSHGNSESAIMSNLNGEALLSIKHMKILDINIDARHVDIVAKLWKSLLPSKKSETDLECAAFRFKARNGILKAEDSIAFETKEIYALGSGVIDLRSEQMNILFKLHPRSQINLEIGSLNNEVSLEGPMDNPELKVSVKGLIQEGGSLVLGVATGGISLLAEKLAKIISHKSSPCRDVLKQE